MFGFFAELSDDARQRHETRVDFARLNHSLSGCARVSNAFRTSEVDERQGADKYAIGLNASDRLGLDDDFEYRVRSARAASKLYERIIDAYRLDLSFMSVAATDLCASPFFKSFKIPAASVTISSEAPST